MTKAITIDDWLRSARLRLATVGNVPSLEARRLVEDRLGISTTRLIIDGRRELTIAERQTLDHALARRLAGEPLALILGRVGFGELELAVTADVLIPRADTETLVETVLARLDRQTRYRVLDLGTGSGAIALSLAHARPAWQIVASDVSPAALACARHNADRLGLSNISFVSGAWYRALRDRDRFDVVVSNPPYIAADDRHLDDLQYEPRIALVAEDDGLADLRHIACNAPRYLRPHGLIGLEHGYRQGPCVRELLHHAGFEKIDTIRDLGGNERATLGRLQSLCP